MAGKPIKVTIMGDVSDLQKKLGEADGALGRFAGGMGKMAKGVGLMAGAAAVGLGAIGVVATNSLIRIERISAQTDSVIKGTGSAAGVTTKQIEDFTTSLEDLTGIEQESIQEGANLLLTFTNIKNGVGAGNDIFNQATAIMTDMSVALGTDASGSAIQLGKALNDPIKGITALTRVGVSFSEEQRTQIENMVKAGDVMGAQKVILAELNKEFGGSAEAFGNTTAGKIEKVKHAFGTVTETLMAQLLPAVTKAAEWLVGFTRNLVPLAEKYGPKVAAVIGGIASWVGDLAQKYGPPLIEFIKGLIGRLKEVAERYGPRIVEFFQKVGDGIGWMAKHLEYAIPIIAAILIPLLVSWAASAAAAAAATLTAAAPFIAIAAAIAAVAAGFVWAYKHVGTFRKIVDAVVTMFREKFLPMLAAVGKFLVEVFQKAVAVAKWVWENFADRIIGILRHLWGMVQSVIQGAIGILGGLFDFIKSLLTGKWGEAWDALVGIVGTIWDTITGFLGEAIAGLGDLLMGIGRAILMAAGNALGIVGGFIADLGTKLWGGVTGVVDDVGSAIGKIPGFLTGILADVGTAALDLGKEIIDGLGKGLGKIGGFVADIGRTIKDAFVNAVNWVVDKLNTAIPNEFSWGPFSLDIPDNPIPRLALATGGPASGMVRVGERGPETLFLPRGSWVRPAHQSGGGQQIIVNVAATNASPWQIGREVAWAAKTSGR